MVTDKLVSVERVSVIAGIVILCMEKTTVL